MATPQSITSHEGADAKKLEQITFRFCSECSNMLYPKEDEDAHKLQFTCRTCQYTEEAQSSCVFRNVLNNSAGETAGVTQDVGSDPTVSQAPPVLCLACGCVIFCDTCGDIFTDVADPDQAPTEEIPSLCQFIQSWSEMDLEEEYEEELMEGASNPALTDEEDAVAMFDKEQALDSEFEVTPVAEFAADRVPLEHLPRSNKNCPRCNHEEAVFFQSQERSAETGMKLFYVCCECGHIFD